MVERFLNSMLVSDVYFISCTGWCDWVGDKQAVIGSENINYPYYILRIYGQSLRHQFLNPVSVQLHPKKISSFVLDLDLTLLQQRNLI